MIKNIELPDGTIIDICSGNISDYNKLIKSLKNVNVDSRIFFCIYNDIRNNSNIFCEMMFLNQLKANGVRSDIINSIDKMINN